MKDQYGREINYLRLSVTDLCNLRCRYCMPAEGVSKRTHPEILSPEEIGAIVRASARCGVRKVRITGGEPLIRRGILDICRMAAQTDGIEEVCMTTNGVLLAQYAEELAAAGVTRLNLSLDTLDPERYAALTRNGRLEDVLEGLRAAEAAGFTNTKINVVLIGGVNDGEIRRLAELSVQNPISVRFIELMPMGQCAHWPRECFLSGDAVLRALPELTPEGEGGVARLFRLPGAKGTVGLISPISQHFCAKCNRIRVTADGKLKPCLHSGIEIPLKGLSEDKLEETIRRAMYEKPAQHHMTPDNPSENGRDMNTIGG